MKGRTVLVTGGNRGLGLETCRQVARLGARVLLTARSEREGTAAARGLEAEGLPVSFRPLDVASSASIAALKQTLEREGVRLDVLVNNAAVSLDGFNAEVARKTLEVNFHGAVHVADALVPLLNEGGSVVMVSSSMGELSCLAPPLRAKFSDPQLTREALDGLARQFVRDVEQGRHTEAGWPTSAYRVSKVALNAWVRIAARELQGRGIRINAVCPGWVRTDMGGSSAPRSVEVGAASIVLAVTQGKDGPSGGFFRDGQPAAW